jgi:hypothetical protein
MALGLLAALLAGAVGLLVLRRVRPDLVPRRAWPRARQVLPGIALSIGYQLSIWVLLLALVSATGHGIDPLGLLGAFGASQLAGTLPGVNGANPRDGALVLGLVALGLPWVAAVGAVSLKAALAWLPALLLGGGSLLLARLVARAHALRAAQM